MEVYKDTGNNGGERVKMAGHRKSGGRALKFNFIILPRIKTCLGLAVHALIPPLIRKIDQLGDLHFSGGPQLKSLLEM